MPRTVAIVRGILYDGVITPTTEGTKMVKKVTPTTARKGRFIKSFDKGEKRQMMNYAAGVEKAMKHHKIPGQVVYTEVTSSFGGFTYQIYVINP